jgi:hypothetical protein
LNHKQKQKEEVLGELRRKRRKMALISSAAVTTINRAPVQANLATPFTGLKSSAGFPVTKKNNDITSITSNGSRVNCMQVTYLIHMPHQKLIQFHVMLHILMYLNVT